MTTVMLAEDFVKGGAENLRFTPKYKNSQGKAEVRPYIKGNEKKSVYIQFGTSDEPLGTRGVLRYDGAVNKYLEVDSPNPSWALADRSGFKNLMTKKLGTDVYLSKYDQAGTQAYWAYEAIKLYVDKLVGAIVNGIPDAEGKLTKVFEEGNITEDMIRHFMTLPYQDKQPNENEEGKFWAPKLKPKVRILVVDEYGKTVKVSESYTTEQMKAFKLDISPKIYDGAEDAEAPNEPVKNVFDHFKNGALGAWICELSPVLFKSKSEINVTIELKKARVFPRPERDEVDFADAPIGGFGTSTTTTEGEGDGEPAAKRAKTENGEVEPLFIA